MLGDAAVLQLVDPGDVVFRLAAKTFDHVGG